jgi:hypothetical protein
MLGKRPQRDTILNGSYPAPKLLKQVAAALQDPTILTEKGGYIFKAALTGEVLHIGLLPTLIGHTRSVHHAIDLAVESHMIINGFFNADGSLAMVLLKPGKKPCLTPEDVPAARELMLRFCSCLLAWQMPAHLPLDTTTDLTLHEAGLAEDNPATLGDLIATLTR